MWYCISNTPKMAFKNKILSPKITLLALNALCTEVQIKLFVPICENIPYPIAEGIDYEEETYIHMTLSNRKILRLYKKGFGVSYVVQTVNTLYCKHKSRFDGKWVKCFL